MENQELQEKIAALEEQVKTLTEARDLYERWYREERAKNTTLAKRMDVIKSICEI